MVCNLCFLSFYLFIIFIKIYIFKYFLLLKFQIKFEINSISSIQFQIQNSFVVNTDVNMERISA